MKSIDLIKNIKNKFSGEILFDENLSKLSWFNLGGPARVLFKPKDLNELSLFLKETKGQENIKVLGAGSNTLIRDGGFDGIIIKLGKSFSHLSLFKNENLIVGASAFDKQVSDFALKNSLTGFEFLSCIPGTIGGAVKMNSGCYGEDVSKIIVSVQAMDFDGNLKIIRSSDIKFSYRKTSLEENLIFISATFKGKNRIQSEIKNKMSKFIGEKKIHNLQILKLVEALLKILEIKKLGNLLKILVVQG